MSPKHIGAGIRWVRQDTEHPRMGQSTPEQFAIPGAAVRPTRKTKTQPLEALDYGVRTALSFEQFETPFERRLVLPGQDRAQSCRRQKPDPPAVGSAVHPCAPC